jgi:hypothetical protein
MGLFANIGKAVNNYIKYEKENLTTQVNVVKALSQGDLNKAKNLYVNQVKKNVGVIEDKLKKATKGAIGIVKDLNQVAGLAPLLPYFLAMKQTLKRRGIANNGTLPDVANKFFHNVVMGRSNYEGDSYDANTRYFGGVDVPVYPQATYVYNNFDAGVDTYCYDLQYNVDGDATPMGPGFNEMSAGQMEAYKVQAMQAENPASGQGFDPNNMIGKAIGGIGGAVAITAGTEGGGAAFAPAAGAAGGAIGGGIEGVVKAIVKWFSTLIKAKKSGQNLGEFAKTASEATSELSKISADEAIAMNAVADSSSTGIGEFVEKNKTMTIVLVVVVLAVVAFVVFRKKS